MSSSDAPFATAAAPLVVERRGSAAWLILSRPEAANALSVALVDALAAAVAGIAADATVRAVVVTGAGKAFCAGADLKERLAMSHAETRAFLTGLGGALDALGALRCPVLAAMNGAAFGGGLELALGADVRIAAEGAQMGLPEARLGIIPGAGGTQRLARAIGVGNAKAMILTGRRIDAAAARAIGLVSEVVPPGELEAAAARFVADVEACGPLAVAEAKGAIDDGLGLPLADALAVERRRYEVVLGSADRDEGLRAFAEKRRPVFKGH